MRLTWRVAALLAVLVPPVAAAAPARLELQPHDHVVVVGNTLAERMQYFGNFETLLHASDYGDSDDKRRNVEK